MRSHDVALVRAEEDAGDERHSIEPDRHIKHHRGVAAAAIAREGGGSGLPVPCAVGTVAQGWGLGGALGGTTEVKAQFVDREPSANGSGNAPDDTTPLCGGMSAARAADTPGFPPGVYADGPRPQIPPLRRSQLHLCHLAPLQDGDQAAPIVAAHLRQQ
ncbi:hypothetical protein ON010_g425 [Phytophthora cinnamomi]|nr:hypothetical protein ON010_g425 [Phytophthora cinnamomi]